MENKKKEIVIILIKSFIMSMLLFWPGAILGWLMGMIYESEVIAVTSMLMVCTVPMMFKYGKLKELTSRKKAVGIIIAYHVFLQISFSAINLIFG